MRKYVFAAVFLVDFDDGQSFPLRLSHSLGAFCHDMDKLVSNMAWLSANAIHTKDGHLRMCR